MPERTPRRKAEHFGACGMAALVELPPATDPNSRALPEEMRQALVELTAESRWPPLPSLPVRPPLAACAVTGAA